MPDPSGAQVALLAELQAELSQVQAQVRRLAKRVEDALLGAAGPDTAPSARADAPGAERGANA